MDTNEIPVSAMHLEKRNRVARKVIEKYVNRDIWKNVILGFAGGITPGTAIPALASSILLQGPVIYTPLSRELGNAYLTEPDQFIQSIGTVSWAVNTSGEVGIELGIEFLKEIITDLIPEALLEVGTIAVGTVIPGISTAAGMALGYVLAKKLTNKVGALMVLYYQNNSKWIGGNRKSTLKTLDALLKADLNFDKFPIQIPEIGETHVLGAIRQLDGFEKILPKISREEMTRGLIELDYQKDTIKKAVDRIWLRRNMLECFNISEIEAMCFGLKIDYEEISGTEKDSKVRGLILYCGRRNLLEELIAACKELRPKVSW